MRKNEEKNHICKIERERERVETRSADAVRVDRREGKQT